MISFLSGEQKIKAHAICLALDQACRYIIIDSRTRFVKLRLMIADELDEK